MYFRYCTNITTLCILVNQENSVGRYCLFANFPTTVQNDNMKVMGSITFYAAILVTMT